MGTKKGKGKAVKGQKKATASAPPDPEEEYKKAPHTFVFNRGKIGKNVNDLLRDVRRVWEPFTASTLKARKKNVLKDFVSIAGVLHVSHFVIFTKTEETVNMRVCRLPRGPTLTFQVESYSLAKDVVSALKRPNMEARQFKHHPLLVMNGFSGEGLHFKLMATMFQNMFPSINVNKVKLKEIRRCLLLNYNEEDKTIEFRHYNVKAVPVGMSRSVKKLIKARVPDLGKYKDMSEYLMAAGDLSESEAELDGPHNEVILPQEMTSRGNIKAAKSAVRLTEIGPRITLRLVKIEEGICEGTVLHHEFIQKTPAEIELMKQMRGERKKIKDERKKKQEMDIKKKDEAKEAHKKKSLAGMPKKEENGETKETNDGSSEEAASEEEMNDADYYREEVGENPEPELFPHAGKKRKRTDKPAHDKPFKKKKLDVDSNKHKVADKGSKFKSKSDKKDNFQDRGKKPFNKFDKKTGKSMGKEKKFGKPSGKKNSKPPAKKGRPTGRKRR